MVNLGRLGPPALLGLLAALGPAWAEEPPRIRLDAGPMAVVSPNQQLAEEVGAQLRASALLKSTRIEVTTTSGTVELEGTVRDAQQREEAGRLAQSVPGVIRVLNRIKADAPAAGKEKVRPAQFGADEPPPSLPALVEDKAGPQEPLPSFRCPLPPPGVAAGGPGHPPLPPYAWPTYAPHNNYSRVAYPNCYPYEAFPYIGPMHPFPKVPLGWRKVVLEFDDSFWWMRSAAQKRDFWQVKFW